MLGFSFNLKTSINLSTCIEEQTVLFAHPGELFAKVPLNGELSEDTDAGNLILMTVNKVLLAPHPSTSKVVFEVDIVHQGNFGYDGKGKDYIYICLTPE